MFILELMVAVFFGTVTYSICWATNNRPLGFMAKMLTGFICVLILIQAFTPLFNSAKSTADTVQNKMDSIERKIDKVDKTMEKIPSKAYIEKALPKVTPKKDGNWFQKFLYNEVLVEEERGN